MGLRRKDRELHWRGLLARQAESGLSVARFCRQESISAPSFYSWRRKLRGGAAPAERDGKAVTGGSISAKRTGSQLVPIHIEPAQSPSVVRILLPEGVSIDAPSNMEPIALAALVGALGEGRRC